MPHAVDVLGSLSIVIPAYNAARHLAATVGEVRRYLGDQSLPHEIVVVDDGSRDRTAEIAAALPDVTLLRFPANRGKGAAVRTGLLAARRDWVLFMDADNSTRIIHLERFVRSAGDADVLIASRRLEESRIVRPQPAFRQWLGRTFPAIVRAVALPEIRDTQCGFKLFRRPVAHALAARQTVERFCFDVELLLIARAQGYRVVEVPINWDNPTDSTLSVFPDAPRMLWDLMRITWRDRIGGYRETG